MLEGAETRTRPADETPDLRLLLGDETFRRRVLSVDPRTGKESEFELSYQVAFRVLDARGEELVPQQTVTLLRDYVFDPNAVAGRATRSVPSTPRCAATRRGKSCAASRPHSGGERGSPRPHGFRPHRAQAAPAGWSPASCRTQDALTTWPPTLAPGAGRRPGCLDQARSAVYRMGRPDLPPFAGCRA